MSEFLAEMQFGAEGQRETLFVRTFPDGRIEAAATDGYDHGECTLTLGQAIQLRDFLNRHIDGLALKQTGSLAQRASDDPTQLASVEEMFDRRTVRLPGVYGHEYDPLAVADFRAQCVVMLAEQGLAVEIDAGVLAFEKSVQRATAPSSQKVKAVLGGMPYVKR